MAQLPVTSSLSSLLCLCVPFSLSTPPHLYLHSKHSCIPKTSVKNISPPCAWRRRPLWCSWHVGGRDGGRILQEGPLITFLWDSEQDHASSLAHITLLGMACTSSSLSLSPTSHPSSPACTSMLLPPLPLPAPVVKPIPKTLPPIPVLLLPHLYRVSLCLSMGWDLFSSLCLWNLDAPTHNGACYYLFFCLPHSGYYLGGRKKGPGEGGGGVLFYLDS